MKVYRYVVHLPKDQLFLLTPDGVVEGRAETFKELEAQGYSEETRITLRNGDVVILTKPATQ